MKLRLFTSSSSLRLLKLASVKLIERQETHRPIKEGLLGLAGHVQHSWRPGSESSHRRTDVANS